MSDLIKLNGVKGFGHHGVLASEREIGQEFIVDVALNLNLQNLKDDLNKTIDYSAVAELIKSEIESNPVNLIETLGERIGDKIINKFELVKIARVTVHKPNAPIPVEFKDVSVTITKTR